MATQEDLFVELSTIAPWAVPIISSATANGGVQTIIDASLFMNPNANFLTPNSGVGSWMFRPTAVAVADRERQIGGAIPIVLASGTITHDQTAYTNVLNAGVQYLITTLQPALLFRLLQVTMRNFLQATYGPLPIFTDADMEATGTTAYTISGLGVLAKVTDAANVNSGTRSMFIDAGTAGEYMEGPSVVVVPSQDYFASVTFRVDAGGPGIFAIWDKTNDVEIQSSGRLSHALERFMSCQRTFKTPADCNEVALRVYTTTISDDIYVDGFNGPHKATDVQLPAPSYVTRESLLRKLHLARYLSQHSPDVYDARSRYYEPVDRDRFYLRADHHHANPYAVVFTRGGSVPRGELWIETLRPAADVTAFAFTQAGWASPTSSLSLRMLGLAWAERVCRHVLSYKKDDPQAKDTLTDVIKELGPLMSDYQRDLESPTYAPRSPVMNMARL